MGLRNATACPAGCFGTLPIANAHSVNAGNLSDTSDAAESIYD